MPGLERSLGFVLSDSEPNRPVLRIPNPGDGLRTKPVRAKGGLTGSEFRSTRDRISNCERRVPNPGFEPVGPVHRHALVTAHGPRRRLVCLSSIRRSKMR